MKKQNYYQAIYIVAVVIFFILGCKERPASLQSLKITADKEGKVENREFKAGETIYAKAEVSGDTSKVKLLLYMTDEQERLLNGTKVILELKKGEIANYKLEIPKDFAAGRYYILAELVKEDSATKGTGVFQLRKAVEVK